MMIQAINKLLFIAGMSALTLTAQGDLSSHLPLSLGKKWVLRGPVNAQMTFEVVEARPGAYRVKWDNPFIQSEFQFAPKGGKYFLAGLTMNGRSVGMAADTLYWDLNAPKGGSWTSSIGTLSVIDRNRTIKARNGTTYKNCVVIKETNKQGNVLIWIFAPNVGFVQFGDGGGAFVLESVSTEASAASPAVSSANRDPLPQDRSDRDRRQPRRQERGRSVAATDSNTGSGKVWVGLAANTFANEAYDGRNVKARFEQSLKAGISYIYISPTWIEVEPDKGKVNLKNVDFQIGQAVSYGVPAIVNLRVIDTNQRSMPADIRNKRLNDPVVKERYTSLLEAIVRRTNGKVKHYLVGNEIESYFNGHKNEINEYAELVGAAVASIKQAQPDALVSISTGFDGLDVINTSLKPISQQTDFLATTYYPLRPDFTVRDASTVRPDFEKMIRAAGDRKILLQEVGYPSDPKNNSSEAKQAEFFATFFDELRARNGNFIGANVCFMSDFSDDLADTFVKYYKAAGADRFRAFLKTLGLFNDKGQPKQSWSVFESKARQITGLGR